MLCSRNMTNGYKERCIGEKCGWKRIEFDAADDPQTGSCGSGVDQSHFSLLKLRQGCFCSTTDRNKAGVIAMEPASELSVENNAECIRE